MKFTANTKWTEFPCYCYLRPHKPELFQKDNIPEGYCGFCKTCGAAGHIRTHPRTSACLGALCDKHFDEFIESIPENERNAGRHCYCFIRNYDPKILKGIPEGYCGLCDECGKPGHTRAYGAFTGTWCDEHWDKMIKKNDKSKS